MPPRACQFPLHPRRRPRNRNWEFEDEDEQENKEDLVKNISPRLRVFALK
jgi:hypothetical protein